MQVESSQTPYEVRCESCQVSFPVGTRVCVHCGERLGRRRIQLVPNPGADEPWEVDERDEDPAAGPGSVRSRFLSPFTLIWLVAAVALSIQRACG